jgi:hypothetical protein
MCGETKKTDMRLPFWMNAWGYLAGLIRHAVGKKKRLMVWFSTSWELKDTEDPKSEGQKYCRGRTRDARMTEAILGAMTKNLNRAARPKMGKKWHCNKTLVWKKDKI